MFPREPEIDRVKIAIIADVHGNTWALEAVLDDIERRGCETIINLGDCVYGPLDPAGTAALLMNVDAPTVRGNQDRILTTPGDDMAGNPTLEYVVAELTPDQVAWFGWLKPTLVHADVFMCHGTPESDEAYLLERLVAGRPALREGADLESSTRGITQPVIACGHSHLARTVRLPDGRLCLNPGSVGLPAYTDDLPEPHVMESGSPHARYAVLTRSGEGWGVDHVAVTYDWEAAARTADLNDRPDWAGWLRTGRAVSS